MSIIGFRSDAEGGSMRWLCDYQRLLVNAFIDIESGGFPFDPVTHHAFIANAKQIYDQYESRLRQNKEFVSYCKYHKIPLSGDKQFNLNSAAQLQKFLFSPKIDRGLSLLPYKRSKQTDKPSSDRESLEHFANEGNEFCSDLLVLRNFSKLLSSFGEPLLAFYSEITGAVHPCYFLAKVVDASGQEGGTHTGRLSCKNPNMQQIPKRDKDDKGVGLAGVDVRRSFIPKAGHVLIEADQSQVEVRVAGMYAKDEQMGEFFTLGGDFHTRVASSVFKQDMDEMTAVLADDTHPQFKKYKQMRSAAKTFTFGLMYGMGIKKLTRQSGLTEEEGEEFIEEYFTTFPHFAEWRQEMIESAKATGYVTTLFGRKRVINVSGYDTEDGREERIGINTPIQSAAADITLYGLARIWEWLKRTKRETVILGTVHDSIIFSMPPEEVNEVLPVIASMMIRPPGLEWLLDAVPVPLSIGVDIGPNFRDMVELNLEDVLNGDVDVKEHM
jgi:DNA polymerase-1